MWQLELRRKRNQTDKVVFNGHDLSSLVYCKISRPVMATVEATFQDVPGRYGETFKSVRRAGYDLPVEIFLRTEDRREVAEARHRLAEALWTDEPAPLYLPDDPTRYLMAIVSGDTDLGVITDDCPTTTIKFHIGDPDFYGESRRLDVASGKCSFAVGGNRPSYLRVTAKPGTCASWRITNTDTGEYVEVNGPLTETSAIGVDMALERATVNGQTASISFLSDFFMVDGRAHVQISSGTATFEWEERWL